MSGNVCVATWISFNWKAAVLRHRCAVGVLQSFSSDVEGALYQNVLYITDKRIFAKIIVMYAVRQVAFQMGLHAVLCPINDSGKNTHLKNSTIVQSDLLQCSAVTAMTGL